MSGLRYESVADMPAGMRKQMEKQFLRNGGTASPPVKESKYHNKPTEVNGIRFPSIREAERYRFLMCAMERGIIRDLRLQVDFTLQEGYTTPEGKRIRAIRYKADFVYKTMGKGGFSGSPTDDEFWRTLPADSTVIEDAKGKRTDVYSIKEKMMKNKGFTIREV